MQMVKSRLDKQLLQQEHLSGHSSIVFDLEEINTGTASSMFVLQNIAIKIYHRKANSDFFVFCFFLLAISYKNLKSCTPFHLLSM